MRKLLDLFFVITIFAIAHNANGQELIPIDSISIEYPVAASIDRLNNIYIGDKSGNLNQYTQGKFNQVFSPQKSGEISLIEAWNPLKIFLFYADFQEYIFLDRFLTSSQRFSAPENLRYSGLITLSADNNLWIIDYGDFGLKKYNINFNQFTIKSPFDLILNPKNYEITFIREYQNLVFISDRKSGILVFDNMGNYLRTLPALGVNYFSFNRDELYYALNDQLVRVNIYSTKKIIAILPEKALFAFLYDNKLALITQSQLITYSIR